MEKPHKTVLQEEAVEALEIKPNGTYIDATFGFGGHTEKMLSVSKDIKIIGIEWDKEIFEHVKKKFKDSKNLVLYN